MKTVASIPTWIKRTYEAIKNYEIEIDLREVMVRQEEGIKLKLEDLGRAIEKKVKTLKKVEIVY